jgi:hypothetical protein
MVPEFAQIDNRSITDGSPRGRSRRGEEREMDRSRPASRDRRARAPIVGVIGILAVLLVAPVAIAACSSTQGSADQMATAMPTMAVDAGAAGSTDSSGGDPQMAGAPADLMPADASAAWAARPDYTKVDSQTEEAYAYALYHPQVVQWMPCYCGCARLDHRSNLDCYLKRAVPGQKTQFEEHASYCEVCVQTTLLTKQLVSEGKSLREIRQAVDSTFGGTTEGTPTQLPPA